MKSVKLVVLGERDTQAAMPEQPSQLVSRGIWDAMCGSRPSEGGLDSCSAFLSVCFLQGSWHSSGSCSCPRPVLSSVCPAFCSFTPCPE